MNEGKVKSLSLHMFEMHAGVEEIFRDRTFQHVSIEMARKKRKNIFMSDSLIKNKQQN